MANYLEYLQPNVTRKEQVSLKSPAGKKLKSWIDHVNPIDLDKGSIQKGRRITFSIPKTSGVYFVIYKHIPVYIGQSCCIHRRIHDFHFVISVLRQTDFLFYLSWVELPRNQRLKAETLLIRRFDPIFNTVTVANSDEAERVLAEMICKRNY